MNSDRFLSLDGLRGIAAAAVMFFHAPLMLGIQLAPSGYLAVDLFFLLSGYVLAHAYGDRIAQGLSPSKLMSSRLKRFYPLHVLGTLLGALLFLGYLFTESDYARHPAELALLLVSGLLFVPWQWFPLNVPSWSLFFELVANFAYVLLGKYAKSKRILLVIALPALGVLVSQKLTGEAPENAVFTIVYQCSRTAFSFFFGVFLYQVKRPGLTVPAPVIMAAVLFLLVKPVTDPNRPLFDIFCIVVAFPLAILLLSADQSQRFARIYRVLGSGSFPLYAIHYPILHLSFGAANFLEINAAAIAWLTIGLLLVSSPMIGLASDAYFKNPRA